MVYYLFSYLLTFLDRYITNCGIAEWYFIVDERKKIYIIITKDKKTHNSINEHKKRCAIVNGVD